MPTNIINNLLPETKRAGLWRDVLIAAIGPVATVLLTLLMPGWLGLQPKVATDNRNGSADHGAEDGSHDGLTKGGAESRSELDGVAPQFVPHDLANEVGGLSAADLNRARLNGRWIEHGDGSYEWVEHALIVRAKTPQRSWIADGPTRWKTE